MTIHETGALKHTAPGYPWKADQEDGTYCNPILWADYPDPDIIRDGCDYYMVHSSFNNTPGLPILHSTDLVNWKIVNHAVKNLPSERYQSVQPGCGVWAPSIRKHAGKFWIFFPMPDEGIYFTTADHPDGTWSPPVLVQKGKGLIDPCPLWDDDGSAYLVHAYARSRAGIKHKLRVCPMAPDGSRLLGEGKIVFDDPVHQPTLEGPKFLKRDGYYYILAPAGGVETGWQLALRSRHIYGPYEAKIILEQGTTPVNGPHQGGLVDTPDGQWWFVHFQDAGIYGRIVHLQPARWENGWPMIGINHNRNGIGEPVLRYRAPSALRRPVVISVGEDPGLRSHQPQTDDDFDLPTLGLQWQWNANHSEDWYSLCERRGWLRLFAMKAQPPSGPGGGVVDLRALPNVLMQRFPAPVFTAETLIRFAPPNSHARAGLAVLGRDYAALSLRSADSSPEIAQKLMLDCVINNRIVATTQLDLALANRSPVSIRLRIHVSSGGLCTFSYDDATGACRALPAEFQASAGVWIGAKIGLFVAIASNGRKVSDPPVYADFDYLHFS